MAGLETAPRPDWMDDKFLGNCIISSKKLPKDSSIDINGVNLYYVVPKGENYMSLIYRVIVEYHVVVGEKSNGTHNSGEYVDSFIVKASHESEELKSLANEGLVFEKEADMYLNVMPKLSSTLDDAGIDGNIACRCLYSVTGEIEVLVMEDLKPKGFISANRVKGLDLAHTKLVFDKLAKMHAASMHYFRTHDVPKLYASSSFDMEGDTSFKSFEKTMEFSIRSKLAYVLAGLNNTPKYGKHVIEFFEKYASTFSELVSSDWRQIPGNKFNALLHGDCWTNNMMFQYNDDGSVQDVTLIDLQISYYSSVATDFIYFFFSNTNDDVRMNHFKKNMQTFYIDCLAHYLQKLGLAGDIPTVEEFDAELRRVMRLALFIVIHFNSFVLAEFKDEEKDRAKGKAFELDSIINDSALNKRHAEVLFLSIDLLEENGYFNNYNLPEKAPIATD